MTTVYEKRLEERKIIKEETRITIIISLAMLFSTICLGVMAYFIEPAVKMNSDVLEKTVGIVNIAVVILMVVILAVRKTIYYSPRVIDESMSLRQVLQKWRTVDIILLAAAETVPLAGLVMALLGMPFNRTFHFFVAAGLLMIILMPIGLKVRSKLMVLRKQTDIE